MNVQYCDKWNKNIIFGNEDDYEPITCSCLSWYPALKMEKTPNTTAKGIVLLFIYLLYIYYY